MSILFTLYFHIYFQKALNFKRDYGLYGPIGFAIHNWLRVKALMDCSLVIIVSCIDINCIVRKQM